MTENASDSILRFQDVSIHFGGETALDKVSFDLKAGETRIIFGAAGSGKSVLLKIALGLLKPDSGRTFLFGRDTTDLKEDDLYAIRSKIGVLFQEGGLFDSFTIEENVSYPLINSEGRPVKYTDDAANRVREALRFVELEQTLEKFPSELSGGMRRRVGIARAAVTQPPLMLYDSPTAGLDPITANTIIALIVKARDTRNTTSAIVTHRYQDGHLIANFRYNPQSGQLEPAGREQAGIHDRTRFMVFQEGRLVFEGTEEELQEQTDPYVSKFKAIKQ
jgi:ABC-type transport system involved in resistance to organic solvents, ATPase component